MLQSKQSWASLLTSRVIRNGKVINHHIFSSIWSSIKTKYGVIMENSSWLLGNGEDIRFWTDSWCGDPFINQVPADNIDINTTVLEFITDSQWNFNQDFINNFPQLPHIIQQVTIVAQDKQDELVWKTTTSGSLSLKEAYQFKAHQYQPLNWAKIIWSQHIPPSKSLLVWRMMHDKLPCDENLKHRGCSLASICNLCGKHEDSTSHLFFQCSYSMQIWRWFESIIQLTIQFSDIEDVWNLCNRGWSPHCQLTVNAALIFIFNAIWFSRNSARFNNKIIPWRTAISNIISGVSLSTSKSRLFASSSMIEFSILKALNCRINPPPSCMVKEVFWSPPFLNWIKANCDGAATTVASSCGGIFRNCKGQFLGGFAENLLGGNSLFAELCGIMRTLEMAQQRNYKYLWLETDSMISVLAFKNKEIVPWHIRNRWFNCLKYIESINFMVSHIYREGNVCADRLAHIGLSLTSFQYFYTLPLEAREAYVHNRLGLPSYRFSFG